MGRLSTVLLCFGLLALLAVPATALSQGGVQSGWTDSPPNLNGRLGPGEWADVARVNLHPSEANGATGLEGKLGDLILGEEVSTEPQWYLDRRATVEMMKKEAEEKRQHPW